VVDAAWVEQQRQSLPELPDAKVARLSMGYGLPAYDARVLAGDVALADYFESVVKEGAEPKAAANWIMTEVMSQWNESGRFAVAAGTLAELVGLVKDGTVSLQAAKKVFAELASNGGTAAKATAERLGLIQVKDESSLEQWVDEVIAANPKEVERYRAGEGKLLGFLVGQVMKRSQGKADPKGVQPVLLRKLSV
jgi:aspartyl-tRNA(Asn)/glutamyl-tRNA(Gln) amidotransferase subunit B